MSTWRNNLLVFLCGATQLVATACSNPADETGLILHAQNSSGKTILPSDRALATPQKISASQDSKTATDTSDANGLSANELIARGQYQLAADEIIKRLKDARVPGMESKRAALLSNLGLAYNKLGRYADAENNLEKALQIWKTLDLTGSARCGRTLNNLASVYLDQRRYAKAEEMFKQALALCRNTSNENLAGENASSQNLVDIALILSNLGTTNLSMGKFSEAEQLFRESLDMQRTINDTMHLLITLNNLALAYKLQGRLEPAAALYSQAVQAWQANAGYERPEVAVGLHNLAMVERALGRTNEAERHFKQALEIVDAVLPAEHPTRIAILDGYGGLLMKLRRKHEARQVQALARAMRARHEHENFQDLTVSVQQIAR